MPPPPPVSSTRTAMTLRPGLSTPGAIEYLRIRLYPKVAPTLTPLIQVVSSSSTIPSCNSAAAVAAPGGSSNVLRNQTTRFRPGSPASSQSVGKDIVFQAPSSRSGALHDPPSAEPVSLARNQVSSWSDVSAKSGNGRSPASLVHASAGVPPHEA